MEFIHSVDAVGGTKDMALRISASLGGNKKVLWLICGGSNVPFAVQAMQIILAKVSPDKLAGLTVAQTDERYGPVGHRDSNWAQLIETGFPMNEVATIPILTGKSLEVTAQEYADKLKPVMDNTLSSGGEIIAQFGIGANGHIAGIYPNSSALTDIRLVSGYDSGDFVRVTIDPIGLRKITSAYVFAFGQTKKQPIVELRDKNLSIGDEPAQILKEIPEVYLYSDQI